MAQPRSPSALSRRELLTSGSFAAGLAMLVKMIKQTRERVGPEGTVMFDAHCAIPPAMLIQLAAAIEPYDILFLEEPAVPGNIEVFKRLKQAIKIPLATGERDRTIWGMIPYLQEHCIDILQPDCAHTGGISQMHKIATLAEAYLVPLAPHCTCSELGVSASLQVALSRRSSSFMSCISTATSCRPESPIKRSRFWTTATSPSRKAGGSASPSTKLSSKRSTLTPNANSNGPS
jgi:L-alanine-DL-glutamate epimerase-like enolase superfamily enzyme